MSWTDARRVTLEKMATALRKSATVVACPGIPAAMDLPLAEAYAIEGALHEMARLRDDNDRLRRQLNDGVDGSHDMAVELDRRDKRIKELEAVCREAARDLREFAEQCEECGGRGFTAFVVNDEPVSQRQCGNCYGWPLDELATRLEEAANG